LSEKNANDTPVNFKQSVVKKWRRKDDSKV